MTNSVFLPDVNSQQETLLMIPVPFRILLASFLFCTMPSTLWAAQPLGQILFDLENATRADAMLEASSETTSSNTPKYNSETANEHVTFEGLFVPASNGTELAIFSDDGCDVFVNGEQIHNRFQIGQHLPDLTQSFHVLSFAWEAGTSYHIRVEYSNTIHPGGWDIDGCTLFAYGGGGSSAPSLLASVLDGDVVAGEFKRFDYLHHNGGAVLRFTVEGVTSGDTPEWTSSAGGAFVGSPTGLSAVWQQADNWISSAENDVEIGCVVGSWNDTFATTVFRIDSQSGVLGDNETRSFVSEAAFPIGISMIRVAQAMDQLPTNVGETKGGFRLVTRAFVGDFANIAAQPIVPEIPDPAPDPLPQVVKRARFYATAPFALWVEVRSGNTPGNVNLVWERASDGAPMHREHMTVNKSDDSFANVTFEISEAAAASAGNAFEERLRGDESATKFDDTYYVAATSAIDYAPKVKIIVGGSGTNAEKNEVAKKYRVGFASNITTLKSVAKYNDGSSIAKVSPIMPCKDGASGELYDPVFCASGALQGATVVSRFAINNETISLRFPDKPHDFAVWWLAGYNVVPEFMARGTGLPKQIGGNVELTSFVVHNTFRTWVIVEHLPTGALKRLHHVDWNFRWGAQWNDTGMVPIGTHEIGVTEPNGDGSPEPIVGGPVIGSLWQAKYYKP